MKTEMLIFVTVTALSTGLIFGAETNKPSAPPGEVGVLTNQVPKLKGFMSKTRVVGHPDQLILDKVKSVKPKLKQSLGPKPTKTGPRTLEVAAEYLARNVSMACPPSVCLEYEDVFYFSGGTTTAPDTNFLSGFAIKKGDTAIHSWKKEREKN